MLDLIINAMEAPILSAQQFAVIIPVAGVVILAVLVFAFGFQKTVEPPSFKQLNYSTDDKKAKKKKIKDKKPQSNGHAVVIDVSDSKKPETPKVSKPVKVETPKPKKSVEVEKEKKVEAQKSPNKKDKKINKEKNVPKVEKPVDFDDGEWETAPSRKDKKKKRDDQEVLPSYTPEKTDKKSPVAKKDVAKKIDVVEFKPMEILKIEDILPPKKEVVVEAVKAEAVEPLASAPVPVAAAEVVPEEPAAAKKKKAKKAKTSVGDDDVAAPPPAQNVAPPKAAPAKVVPAAAPVAAESQPQAFNELEDVWQEAPQKKSKKKARKD